MTRPFAIVLLCVASAGCVVGPRYVKPATTPSPPAFAEMAGNDQWKMATPIDDQGKGKWWEIFGDPQLNALEELVDINNQNLKQAEAQFREARTVVAGNRANYYPTIGVAPTITQTSTVANIGRVAAGTFETYSLPVDVAWEPDLWGRVRLSVEGAMRSAQASAADLENVRLSEQSLLATDYFGLAANDMQQGLLADTIAAYAQNLRLTTDRFNAGIASRSDIALAQAQLSGAEAQSTDLRATRAQFEHAIAVLTGRVPATVQIGDTRIAGPPPPVPTALPSELLERRPDIAATERLVAVANANIGLAEVAYYPTLQLSANPALIASTVRSLFSWAARSWTGSAQLSETVADFGRRHAALQGARAAFDAANASYQQTVLSAFQEVEDSLADLRYLAEEAGQQQEAVAASQISLNLELDRYRAGTDSYINVITTQTILLGNQQTAVTILQRRLTAAVNLVKAVGGGWTTSMLPSDAALRSSH
jgi:NodT family efflux transporter outer membrane factor (OMF) lipoprotein